MKGNRRQQLFVDHKVQGALMLRAAGYWVMCLVTVTLLMICWRMLTGPARAIHTHFDDLWFQFAPAVVMSMLLLPIVVIDSVRLTNRFAGPMYRLRRSLRQLGQGEEVPMIHFREGDFWHDFADDYNQLVRHVQDLRERAERAEANALGKIAPRALNTELLDQKRVS